MPLAATTKTEECYQAIARDIATGRIAPGGRLPRYRELQKQLGVSYITVLSCVRQLKSAGLVVGRERAGLYAAAAPPNVNRFILLLPKSEAANRYLDVVGRLLPEEAATAGIEVVTRRDFEPHPDNPVYRQTLADARARRIAGVGYISMPILPPDCELCGVPGFPLINLSTLISFERDSFAKQAVDVLRRHGSRRIAALVLGRPRTAEGIERILRAQKLPVVPHWLFPIGTDTPEAAAAAVRLMLDLPKNSRPNGLIVADDNLVEQALKGVYQSGVRVPDDLRIIVHCNWPEPVPSNLPVTYLGYDVRSIARHCVAVLREACRHDDDTRWSPPTITMRAEFEREET